jgi:hypothetical protein
MRQVNLLFSDESIGWNMSANGQLHRTLPEVVRLEEETIFRELQNPRFAVAFGHLQASRKAYNARPRKDREVCSEVFDALESTAKEVFALSTGTFGDVIKAARSRNIFASETLSSLERLYVIANNHFRHGMTKPVTLTNAEVDFFYVSSLAGILFFVRVSQA